MYRGSIRLKSFVLPGLLFPFFLSHAQQDPCNCSPKVGSVRPYRLPAKWDTLAATYPKSNKPIRPSAIHRWETKYAKKVNENTTAWNTPRIKGSPEDSLYALEGWLWYVKGEVDCDYHVQIGRKSKSAARRAVVEVTIKNCALQRMILDTLRGRGYTVTDVKRGIELKRGIPVLVTGLGFYDGQHGLKEPSDNTPDDSPLWKQEGTAWELHPVVSFEFR